MSKSNRPTFKLDTDLASLRTLVAVVEEEGFSAASKRTHRTQSAISLQVAKLEERLNTKLLERSGRKTTLTPAGEVFVSYARRMLELADEAVLAVTSPEESTVLKVGFAEYLAPHHLHRLLSRFRRAHPNCDLNLTLGSGSTLLPKLDEGELDIVIAGPEAVNGELLWEEQLVWTGVRELVPTRLVCEGSDGGENTPASSIDLVLIHAPCSYRRIAIDALTKAGIGLKVVIDANSSSAVQASVRAGVGVSVLPLSAVHEDMPILYKELPELPKTSVMSYARADLSHPYAQRFVDFLLDSMKDDIEGRQKMVLGMVGG